MDIMKDMKCVNEKLTHEKAILTKKALLLRKRKKEQLAEYYTRERKQVIYDRKRW